MAVYKRGLGNQKCYHSGINCINMESILLPEKMNILYRIAKQDFYAEYIEFLLSCNRYIDQTGIKTDIF